MKTFLLYLRGGDKIKSIAKSITIKTKKRKTKFKLSCQRYVYTLKVDDEKKAEKLKTSIPKEITKIAVIKMITAIAPADIQVITRGEIKPKNLAFSSLSSISPAPTLE